MLSNTKFLTDLLQCLSDAKAKQIVRYQVENIISYTDDIIITTGMSGTHVKSIIAKTEEYFSKINLKPYTHVRKRESYEWVILDYNHIVVHVFQQSTREFYNLDDYFQQFLPQPKWEVFDS